MAEGDALSHMVYMFLREYPWASRTHSLTFGVAFLGLDAGNFFGVTCAEGFLGLGA